MTDATLSPTSVPDEGDIAADYIEELLDITDLDGDIEIEVTEGRTTLTVGADGELPLLSHPETVAALQELTRLAVQNGTGEFSRLVLDIGGSRNTRKAQLSRLVDRAEAALDGGAERYDFAPLSSYERKIVHDIAAERGLTSESEGEGRDRHIVVTRG